MTSIPVGSYLKKLTMSNSTKAQGTIIKGFLYLFLLCCISILRPPASMAAIQTINVTKTGPGDVYDTAAQIDCGPVCTGSYNDGDVVTLKAAPATGYVFTGWTGACSGSDPCTITIASSQSVGATFAVEPTDPGVLTLGWTRAVSTGTGYTINEAPGGGVIYGGNYSGPTDFDPGPGTAIRTDYGGTDVFLSSLNADGSFNGVGTMGSWHSDYELFSATDPSGNTVTTGSFKAVDYFIAPFDLDPTSGTDFYTADVTSIFITKVAPDGTNIWASVIGEGGLAINSNDIALDSNGNIYITGSFVGDVDFDPAPDSTYYSPNVYPNRNMFLTKLDPDGEHIWTITHGGATGGHGEALALDPSGNIFLHGRYINMNDFNPDPLVIDPPPPGPAWMVFVSKFDPNGVYQWSAPLGGGTNSNYARDIATDGEGNVYAAVLDRTGHLWDVEVTKIGPDGVKKWVRIFGGPGNDDPKAIAVDSSGDIYVTGTYEETVEFDFDNATHKRTSSGGKDIFTTMIKSDGTYGWTITAGGAGDDTSEAITTFNGITATGQVCDGGVYTTGRFYDTVDFDPTAGFELLAAGVGYSMFVTRYERPGCYPNTNNPPVADAGVNITISSEEISSTVIQGIGTDEVDNDTLECRWLNGGDVLLGWTPVGPNGECSLYLNSTPLTIGTYTLTVEVSDGQATASDDMILSIDNSAPHPAPIGAGVYEVNTPVTLAGDVSDFDGDMLTYEWIEGGDVFSSGTIQAISGGTPVALPLYVTSSLGFGIHTITLQIDDGINAPVSKDITVEIVDTAVPTLAPVPDQSILWPPNHKMVDIFIDVNAVDNSGDQVTITAVVTSDEPIEGLGDGDMAPDWTEPVIDQTMGTMTLQLRSERSGSGDGRVYTITITATDSSGNSSTTSIEIIVPHDKSKK